MAPPLCTHKLLYVHKVVHYRNKTMRHNKVHWNINILNHSTTHEVQPTGSPFAASMPSFNLLPHMIHIVIVGAGRFHKSSRLVTGNNNV